MTVASVALSPSAKSIERSRSPPIVRNAAHESAAVSANPSRSVAANHVTVDGAGRAPEVWRGIEQLEHIAVPLIPAAAASPTYFGVHRPGLSTDRCSVMSWYGALSDHE